MADKTDTSATILRDAVRRVERGYDDRWPARGKANSRGSDYRPLDEISREGAPAKYRKYPSAGG